MLSLLAFTAFSVRLKAKILKHKDPKGLGLKGVTEVGNRKYEILPGEEKMPREGREEKAEIQRVKCGLSPISSTAPVEEMCRLRGSDVFNSFRVECL